MSIILKARGVRQVSRGEMLSFPVPEATLSYCPISNAEIISTTLEELDRNGFRLKSEFHKCDGSKNKFVGGFIVTGGNSEADLMFGYKNSYDYSMSAAYAIGAQIMICSNSVVRGDQALIRKHTGSANIDIKKGISLGIKMMGENFQKIERELQRMKEIEVSMRINAEIIGRLYIEEEIITSHQLSVLRKELRNESFDYNVKDTLFNTYQAVTHSLKTSHPTQFLNDHIDAHRFFVGYMESLTGDDIESFEDTHIILPSTEDKRQLKLFPEIYENIY